MNALGRMAMFSVASGTIWSVIASLPMGNPTLAFGPNLIAGIATSFLVSLALWRPLIRLKAWGRWAMTIVSYPLSIFFFFVCFFLSGTIRGAGGINRVSFDEVSGLMISSVAYSLQGTMFLFLIPEFYLIGFPIFALNVWLLRFFLARTCFGVSQDQR
jgi:hypothetical protein